jgi:hypothetical protein
LTGKVEPVEIDDACSFLCHFNNGSLGLFESTRYARGHKALYTFEINGENMSLKWDLHDLHRLQIFDYSDAGPSGAGRACMSPTATTPIWPTGGCLVWRLATSTLCASGCRFPCRLRQGRALPANLPRCLGNPEGLRCGACQCEEPPVGQCLRGCCDDDCYS